MILADLVTAAPLWTATAGGVLLGALVAAGALIECGTSKSKRPPPKPAARKAGSRRSVSRGSVASKSKKRDVGTGSRRAGASSKRSSRRTGRVPGVAVKPKLGAAVKPKSGAPTRSKSAKSSKRKSSSSSKSATAKKSGASSKSVGAKVANAAEKVKEKAVEVKHKVEDKATEVKHKIENKAGQAKQKVEQSFKSQPQQKASTSSQQQAQPQQPKQPQQPQKQASTSSQRTVYSREEVSAGRGNALHVTPPQLHFKPAGGISKLFLHNPTSERQAIKVKCSDNNAYRVNPVYAVVAPGESIAIDVHRDAAPSKIDKLVFVAAKIGADNVNPKTAFSSVGRYPKIAIPLIS